MSLCHKYTKVGFAFLELRCYGNMMISTNQSTVSQRIRTNESAPLSLKGSHARREEEERAGQRRVLCLQAEELAREFQQVWQSSSQPDLSLAQSGHLLDQLHSADLSLVLVQINQDTVL